MKLKVFPNREKASAFLDTVEGDVDRLTGFYDGEDGIRVYCVAQGDLHLMAGRYFSEVTFPEWEYPVPEDTYVRAKALGRTAP